MGKLLILAALLSAGLASGAGAQTICGKAHPPSGEVLHGPVLAIPNASTLCLATGPSPAQWTAVSVPQLKVSRAVLMAAAFGQNATCVIRAGGVGECRIEDAPLATQVRRPEIVKAALQWRDQSSEAPGPTQLASNTQ